MIYYEYPKHWEKEKVELAQRIASIIEESNVTCFDACSVMKDISGRIENIARRSGELFTCKEVMPRVEEYIKAGKEYSW